MDRTLKLNPHARPALSDADVYKAMERLGAYVDITPADFRAIYEDAWTIARQKLLDEVTAGDMMSENFFSRKSDIQYTSSAEPSSGALADRTAG